MTEDTDSRNKPDPDDALATRKADADPAASAAARVFRDRTDPSDTGEPNIGEPNIGEASSGEVDPAEAELAEAELAEADSAEADAWRGKRVALVGKLGGVSRREAHKLLRERGAAPVDETRQADVVIIGADELPINGQGDVLPLETRQAASEGRVEILSETQLWQRLGLLEAEQNVRRLYTPAMLADLLCVPLATVRRWYRKGLIVPARVVRRLPYFDFQEVAAARRLARLLAEGASAATIEKQLAELAQHVPEIERPLAQLAVIARGPRLLFRHEEGLVESSGQRQFDFEAIDDAANPSPEAGAEGAPARVLSFGAILGERCDEFSPEHLCALAQEAEDEGWLEQAEEIYRAALAAGGPRADVCFQLAELLYRRGEVQAARERYFMAIELDEAFVEARANLGCVLAELGQLELAAAAFRGALRQHADYADAHFHLARVLDELGQPEDAETHWRRFVRLAPTSPWVEEARIRLDERGDD